MTASITRLPLVSVDTPALIAARERASYGVADEADAALLGESRHGTDRILARNIRAAIEAERTRPLHVRLAIAAALVFSTVAVTAIITLLVLWGEGL